VNFPFCSRNEREATGATPGHRASSHACRGTVDPAEPAHPALLRAANQAAHQLGIDLVQIEVSGPNDIENAFDVIMRERVDAVAALQGVEFYRIRARIAELGLRHRMPVITGEDGSPVLAVSFNMAPARPKTGVKRRTIWIKF
jgi:hypothetical protein